SNRDGTGPGSTRQGLPSSPECGAREARMIEPEVGAAEVGFRPSDVSFVANPYPVYAELRARAPVLYDEATDHWLVSRYRDVAGGGEFDLIPAIAEPLPVAVIAELLGIPESDRHLLRPWSAEICLMYELNPSEGSGRRAVRASVEFSEYLRRLSRERRANPT